MKVCIEAVTGQITLEGTRKPIHGLLVEAWGFFGNNWIKENDCDIHLGCNLTNHDGMFTIPVKKEDLDKCCQENPEIYLKIRDRDGRVIDSNRKKIPPCSIEKSLAFEISLDSDALDCHLSRPVSWECLDDPLIPLCVINEIEEAIALLTPPNQPGYAVQIKAIACVEPSLILFDKILRDAWDTLQGDLAAAARYRDVLKVICAHQANECCAEKGESFSILIDNLLEEDCDCDPCKPKKPTEVAECKDLKKEPFCPDEDMLISNEKATILVMAALHVTCGHHKTIKAYVSALLNQICRFQFLGALHRSAVQALCGDTNALSHFQDLLEFIVSKCQPHSGNYPIFSQLDPLSCCETCLNEDLTQCIRDAFRNWCRIHCYTVTNVSPKRACPGDKIVICGHGFGHMAGQVAFYQKGTLAPGPRVNPESWTDHRICVVVPEGAGCGLVLNLPVDTVSVCDRFLDFRPSGYLKDEFEGTSAEILKFIVKDHINNECLLPGEPLQIRWKTCAADGVKIEIIDETSGDVIDNLDPAELQGKWDFTETNFDQTTRLKVQITAQGICTPREVVRAITFIFQNPANLTIDGIEVSQAIQYYKAAEHLTDPVDRGADNSVRLVTNKTAWVRVYLRSGQDPAFDNGQVPQVDGILTVERRVNNVWGVIANLASQNGSVTAEDSFISYDAERGNINNSLNFVVPANLMTGLLRFRVQVSSPFVVCGDGEDTAQTVVNVNLTQTLNAAFFTIGYNGPDNAGTGTLNLPAPTLAQCQAETSWAMTTYPVSGNPNVRVAGTFTTNTPLNDPRSCPGCCSPNWSPLLQQLANLVVADQSANPGGNWVYYGIINNGIPITVPGCSGIATGGLAGQPVTYAHEIGHQFGLPHARCGPVGGGNPAYPVYEPYDVPVDPPGTTNWTMASLGEYGLDINNGAIANPNTFEDFMSYCGPRWISLFTYNFLVNAPNLVPQVIPTGDGGAGARIIQDTEVNEFVRDQNTIEPFVHLLGTVNEDGEVEVTSVSRLDTRYLVGDGQQTGYVVQLLDESGSILAQDSLYRFDDNGSCSDNSSGSSQGCCEKCDDDRNFMFKAMLNDNAPGACLQIIKGSETVWQRYRPSEQPVLSNVCAGLHDNNCVNLTWHYQGSSELEAEFWVRWSNDDGDSWNALTVGLEGREVTLNLDDLPYGDIRFQVLAHDGFSTVSAATETVRLAPKPPAVSIFYPKEGDQAYTETLLHLWGTATNLGRQTISDDQFVWYIDELEVGSGRDIWVTNPGIGLHRVRLEVIDESEQMGVATSTVEIQA